MIAALALVLVLAGLALLGYRLVSERHSGPLRPLTVAISTTVESALVLVAQQQGYFRQQGLAVSLSSYRYGRAALEAMMAGEAQIATATETPITLAILDGAPLSILATIAVAERNLGVVARRDAGIAAPPDLRGKRLGVTRANNTQFFLHVLLSLHGIPDDQVSWVFLAPDELAEALAQGRVDAVVLWQPWLLLLDQRLGANAVSFDSGDLYTQTFNVVTTARWAEIQSGLVAAFLRALLQAEAFVRTDPATARELVATATGWDPALLARVWEQYRFRAQLAQGLVVTMEEQARWALEAGLIPGKAMPNFLDYLHFGGLDAVAPDRITLVR